mgnify:CR=1 FL=1
MKESSFFINYDMVITNKKFLNSTRLLAVDISENGYLSLSDYLKKLSNEDLKYLIGVSENPEDDAFGELIIVAETMAIGEGLEGSKDDEDIFCRVKMMIAFLVTESLYRKGLIKIFRENMSFGEDYSHKNIAEKLNDE